MKNNSHNRLVSVLVIAVLVCAFGAAAFAEDVPAVSRTAFSISGYVVAGESVSLTAPYGGRIMDYAVRVGDILQAGQTAFSIETMKIYAPCDGTIGGVRALPGDETSFVQQQYGALMYLEPVNLLRIETTTAEAYDNNENKLIHVGEIVYLQSNNARSRTGTGRVIIVDGKSFSVEVIEGSLRVDERTSIYRQANYENQSCVGIGRTVRVNPIAITGEGSVLEIMVREGQQVKRGDVLAELAEGVLSGHVASTKQSEVSIESILYGIAVQPGQQVSRGQVLATLHPVAKLEVEADIHELDLDRIQVGDTVQVEIMGLRTNNVFMGAITNISSLSHAQNGDAEYKVYLSLPVNGAIREGMSATVYLNE